MTIQNSTLSRKDFTNDKEVRWCPGCGDYAILAAIQKMLPNTGLPPEKHVFVSGIGCAGRLPYYMNAYGLHTIHGRATAVATGLKSLRDDLSVWVVTGDGDALSIGATHLIHCLRRNVNINILLINNQVYGLTKGQFSPTSKPGQITKTSPRGVATHPINPLSLALSAGASFAARGVDKDPNTLATILEEAYHHKGCSFVEIYQDCHIFNHGAFDEFSQKTERAANTIQLLDGEPMLYGKEKEKALQIKDSMVQSVDRSESATIHRRDSYQQASQLAHICSPDLPVPLGVLYQVEKEVYQHDNEHRRTKDELQALYRRGASWKQA